MCRKHRSDQAAALYAPIMCLACPLLAALATAPCRLVLKTNVGRMRHVACSSRDRQPAKCRRDMGIDQTRSRPAHAVFTECLHAASESKIWRLRLGFHTLEPASRTSREGCSGAGPRHDDEAQSGEIAHFCQTSTINVCKLAWTHVRRNSGRRFYFGQRRCVWNAPEKAPRSIALRAQI